MPANINGQKLQTNILVIQQHQVVANASESTELQRGSEVAMQGSIEDTAGGGTLDPIYMNKALTNRICSVPETKLDGIDAVVASGCIGLLRKVPGFVSGQTIAPWSPGTTGIAL